MRPLDLHLKPSRYLTWAALVVWALLVALLLSVTLLWWQNLAFVALSSWLLLRWLRRYAWLRAGNSLQSIRINVHQWRLQLANGQVHDAQLASGSRFLPGFIILRMQVPAGPVLWQLLLADSADVDGLRRLRVWGRWGSYTQ